MKLIDRYEFTNGRAFETYYLDADDLQRRAVPECDVIGFQEISPKSSPMRVMRPDEALIQARMLIDAVYRTTGEYEIELKPDNGDKSQPLSLELVDDLEGTNDATAKES